MSNLSGRRLAIGAEPMSGGVDFRVWAPEARRLRVVFVDPTEFNAHELSREEAGYFSGFVPAAGTGTRYFFELDAGVDRWPDPASRFQPAGPLGPSEVVNPDGYAWNDAEWPGLSPLNQVLYEMHIGTFTPEGTWRAATEQLAELAALGITALEIMPIAEFAGRFGWSYDPANLFAPSHWYGPPDAVCRFVDEAHRWGLGVILDVVYNHFSRLGERLLAPFASSYFSERYKNEWGASPNFDDRQSESVRAVFYRQRDTLDFAISFRRTADRCHPGVSRRFGRTDPDGALPGSPAGRRRPLGVDRGRKRTTRRPIAARRERRGYWFRYALE